MTQPNEHVLDFVDDYLHDALSRLDAVRLEGHCERCRSCQAALEEACRRFSLLPSVPASEASEQLIQSSLRKIDTYERQRLRRRQFVARGLLGIIAASVLLLGGWHLYYLNLSPTPYDLRILGPSQMLADTVGSLRIRLLHHQNGTAVAGVPVDVELHDRLGDQAVHLCRFITDTQGTGQPRFRLPDWADGAYELRITAHPAGAAEVMTRTIQLKRSWKLMLSSDKPVYQPGQVIHIRALALRRPDLGPAAGREVTFSITDPRGNVIFKRQDVTSKHGIAAIDCPLAQEITEGRYTIACQVGDTQGKRAVEVRKYTLPKFKIDVELDRPCYQPGQKLRGKVHAAYFFGKPVAGGTVQIDVRDTDRPANRAEQRAELTRLDLRTDGNGDASFECTVFNSLAGRAQESGRARIFLDLTVSDPAGQKQTRSLARTVTADPLQIEVIPEAGALVWGLPNTVFLYTGYPDGRPARTRLAVSGVEKELVTNALGVASLEITPNAPEVAWMIRATDEKGVVVRRHVRLPCERLQGDFLVRTDKAVYDGGETVNLVVLGGGTEPVFVDLIKDGQVLLTESVALANGCGERRFDLPPDLFGTVELCAYRFVDMPGSPVRKARVLYIRPAEQVTIKTTLDHAEYRPGGRARLQVALTDRQGRPAAGAVSLAAVDEAVFSVLEQAPGMERTFYLLEPKLLEPVYAVHPWSPEPTPGGAAEERTLFERALFARTADREGGPLSGARPRAGKHDRQRLRLDSVYSLSASSFASKEREIADARLTGLRRVTLGWWLLLLAFGVGGYIALWLFVRPLWKVVLAHGLLALYVVLMQTLSVWEGTWPPRKSMTAAEWYSAIDPADGNVLGSDWGGESSGPASRRWSEPPQPESDQQPETSLAPIRVRECFPETLLWRPELITDDQGHAGIDVDLADSITTWRLTASAVTADGRLGATESTLRVFQPFFVDLNLPAALTRGDEAAVPVVVYNYLDQPQAVELTLTEAAWFERLTDAVQRLDLKPHEVRSTSYRVRVTGVGNQQLRVTARGSGVADALQRPIEVVPDGRRVEQVMNGTLEQPVTIDLSVPPEAIAGSAKALLKIYPSGFSQLVEGLDAIFRMPSGCFEQTSSATYPNVLALNYLRQANKSAPEVEAKARHYIHLGCQRLLGFEVPGGGFDWFGQAPANRTLTAYGLMEFRDMARVHEVDPKLIERTRAWLLHQCRADGSWPAERGMLNDGLAGNVQRGEQDLGPTAYVAWAVFGGQERDATARKTLAYLLSHRPETIHDPHVLALVCNALVALDPTGNATQAYLNRLDSLKRASDDGKRVWWEQSANARTTFYGSGRSGSIETTALATLALLSAGHHPGTARGALTWLVEQKDAHGTWYSTQATVLALKALLAGTSKSLGGSRERRIEMAWDDGKKREVVLPADQADVVRQIDLSDHLGAGNHRLTLTESSGTAAIYQVAFRHHVPQAGRREAPESLAIRMSYDRTELGVGETALATATVENRLTRTAPMVILDLPIPAGFTLAAEDLARSEAVARYQVNPRGATVYLRGLEPGKPLEVRYHLRAGMPVKVTVPPARVYEYYDPSRQGRSASTTMLVTPGE